MTLAIRIILRCFLEFGPPAGVAFLWVVINWNGGSPTVNFSGAFVTSGLIWWNFLRIQYQQATRANQEEAANQIGKVIADLASVERLLKELSPILVVSHNNLSPEQATEINTAVGEASKAVSTAVTALSSIASSIRRAIVLGIREGVIRRDKGSP